MMNGFSGGGGVFLLKTNISRHENMNSKPEFVFKIMTKYNMCALVFKPVGDFRASTAIQH